MDYAKIINMQKELDSEYTKSGFLQNDFVNEKRILAILVELGEFANEYSPFKYWKKTMKINHDKLLEEFVDGVHFFATFINLLKINKTIFEPKVMSNDKSLQLLYTFKSVIKMFNNLNRENLVEAFHVYLGNAELLNITSEDIIEAYIIKNKINKQRIKSGY